METSLPLPFALPLPSAPTAPYPVPPSSRCPFPYPSLLTSPPLPDHPIPLPPSLLDYLFDFR